MIATMAQAIMQHFTVYQVYSIIYYYYPFVVTSLCKSGNFTVEDKTRRICLFGQCYTLCGNNLRYCPVKQYSDYDKCSLKAGLICKGITQLNVTIYLVYFYSQPS